ncbi:MAG: non-canonical purine NTP pyrophosphatase [Verrucomicrobiota bacterium]
MALTFYLASGNAHKAAELQGLAQASGLPVTILSARSLGGMPPVEEDTGTFVGNARKKAQALWPLLPAGAWALADDSGVCVDALEGAPGVESAYYAGPQGDAAANLAKLVMVMRDVPEAQRRARFYCVLVALGPKGGAGGEEANGAGAAAEEEQIFEGACEGQLLYEPKGGAGFGYDPLFVPDGYDRSYAELGDDVKNQISHRARAWARMAEWVRGKV